MLFSCYDVRRWCSVSVLLFLLLAALARPLSAGTPDAIDLRCPPGITVSVSVADTGLTGVAEAGGDCGAVTITYSDSATASHDKQPGVIVRRWVAVDTCGGHAECRQIIHLSTVPPRIAVLPFENLSSGEEGARVFARLMESMLARSPAVELISPGETENALLHARLRSPMLMDNVQQRKLTELLDVHYLVLGSILAYEVFDDPYAGRIPVFSVSVELRQAGSGRTIWAETYHSVGNDGEWLFGLGVDHDITRMAEKAARKAQRRIIEAIRMQ